MIVVSTLPHYLSILPYNIHYTIVVVTSTTFSILYHTYDNKIITFLDYFMALIWFLSDVKLASNNTQLKKILVLNGIIFLLNISMPNNLHSLWHLLSALKCYYVSRVFLQEQKTVICYNNFLPEQKIEKNEFINLNNARLWQSV